MAPIFHIIEKNVMAKKQHHFFTKKLGKIRKKNHISAQKNPNSQILDQSIAKNLLFNFHLKNFPIRFFFADL